MDGVGGKSRCGRDEREDVDGDSRDAGRDAEAGREAEEG